MDHPITRALARAAAVSAYGALFGLAYLPGLFGWVAWVGLAPYLWTIDGRDPLRAFLWGWLFSTSAWAVAIPTFGFSAGRFLGASPAVCFGLHLAATAAYGLPLAIAALAARASARPLQRRLGWPSWSATAAAAVPAVVLADAWVPQYIPYRLPCTQGEHLPAIQCVESIGLAGLAALLVASNAALYGAVRGRFAGKSALALAALVGLFLANEAYGIRRMKAVDGEVARLLATGRSLRLAVIQPVVAARAPVYERFSTDLALQRRLSLEALSGGPVDLVVWPETSFDRLLEFGPEGAASVPTIDGAPFERVVAAEAAVGSPLLFNAIGRSSGRAYSLSVLSDGRGKFIGAVRKRRPIPFGEYLPWGDTFPALYRLSPRTWRLGRAARPETLALPGKTRLGMLVCYEEFFDKDAKALAALGAGLLLSQTNDAWFTGGYFEEQHLRIAAFRAVEARRYLARAVNTGVSAVLSPTGRVLRRLGVGERGAFIETVAIMGGAPTP